MAKIATPQQLVTDREGALVVLHIRDGGTLKMPRDAAHELAQGLMKEIAAIDKQFPNLHPWRRPFRS